MEAKIRKKWPHIKTMADLPKLGAFITFNRTSQMVACKSKF